MPAARRPEHGVAERLVLDPQRLRLGERVAGHVALGDAAERRHRLPLGRRSCRWRRTSGRRSSVSATKAPVSPVTTVTRSLSGREPVDQVVDDDAVRQPADRPRPCPRARGRSGGRSGATTEAYGALRDPGGEVDVVRGEVLDHADVGDPRRERALPPGGDLVDLAELARPRCARAAPAAPGCSARCARRRRPGPRPRTRRRAAAPASTVVRRAASRPGCARRPRPARAPTSSWKPVGHGDHAMSMPGAMSSSTSGRTGRLAGDAVRVAARVGDRDQLDAVESRAAPGRGGGPSCRGRCSPARRSAIRRPPSATRVDGGRRCARGRPALSEGCTGSDSTSRGRPLGLGQVEARRVRRSDGSRWFGIG